MKQRLLSMALAGVLCLSMTVPASAAEQPAEIEIAGAFLHEQGIYQGDASGNLMLDKGLSRAELAVILTRLHSEDKVDPSFYTRACYFKDVPEWAKPYVGYCAANLLVTGYNETQYGPDDLVTPAMACTVVFRCCGYESGEGSVWTYGTACDHAVSLGLISQSTAQAPIITRGEMAVLISRMRGSPLTNGKPVTEENVMELLRQIEQDWPTGTTWGTHNTPGTRKNEIASTESGRIMRSYHVNNVYGCGAYASMVSSLIFGDKTNRGRRLNDLSQIRPGDIIFYVRSDNGKIWHVAVALESPNEANAFYYTDGNAGETIQWPDRGSPYSNMDNLDCYRGENQTYHLEVWTRYPESIPFTGNSIGAWFADDERKM